MPLSVEQSVKHRSSTGQAQVKHKTTEQGEQAGRSSRSRAQVKHRSSAGRAKKLTSWPKEQQSKWSHTSVWLRPQFHPPRTGGSAPSDAPWRSSSQTQSTLKRYGRQLRSYCDTLCWKGLKRALGMGQACPLQKRFLGRRLAKHIGKHSSRSHVVSIFLSTILDLRGSCAF